MAKDIVLISLPLDLGLHYFAQTYPSTYNFDSTFYSIYRGLDKGINVL